MKPKLQNVFDGASERIDELINDCVEKDRRIKQLEDVINELMKFHVGRIRFIKEIEKIIQKALEDKDGY